MRKFLVFAALALLGAGCPSSSTVPPAPTVAPTPSVPSAPSPVPTPPAPPTHADGLGSDCGANDGCAPGQTCVTYYGIAGPRGPEFKSCEIPCAGGRACPAGLNCLSIADGPGQVCR